MENISSVQLITQQQDNEFDYDLVRAKYYEECMKHFKNPSHITGPWTLKARKDIISYMKTKSYDTLYDLQPDELSKYQIVCEDGEEKIVLQNTAIELLPFEECFDIFVETHRSSNHGHSNVIQTLLEKKFIVNDACLKVFLSHCNVCNKYKVDAKPRAYNDRIIVEIVEALTKDKDCKYVLFYLDKATTFMLLRPLVSTDECELCVEMLKIFTDFGPPLGIETIHVDLLSNVLSTLSRAGLNYTISLYKNSKQIGEEIIKSIISEHANWATTCRFAQLEHNNTSLTDIKFKIGTEITPISKLFSFNDVEKVPSDNRKSIHRRTYSRASNKNVNFKTHDDIAISSKSTDDGQTDEVTNIAEEGEDLSLDEAIDSNLNKSTSMNETNDTMEDIESNEMEHDQLNSGYQAETFDVDNIRIKEELTIEETTISGLHSTLNPSFIETEAQKTVSDKKSNEDSAVLQVRIIETQSIALKTDSTKASEVMNDIIMHNSVTDRESNEELKLINKDTMKAQNSITKTDSDFINADSENNMLCSNCKGRMFTDYFCFVCKKKTHIFCMTRVTDLFERDSDAMTSFTYCSRCIKTKHPNLEESLEEDLEE